MTHSELVERAARWLMNSRRCGIVVTEMCAPRVKDIPDALGWVSPTGLIVVECKTSISDYYADSRKEINRQRPFGIERWYLCEKEVLEPERIRDGWGLLWAYPTMLRKVKPAPTHHPDLEQAQREAAFLYQVAHRLWANITVDEHWGIDRIHLCPLNDALTKLEEEYENEVDSEKPSS